MTNKTMKTIASVLTVLCFLAAIIQAQTTAFNFQGRLNDGANPANGNVEMQIKLYDTVSGGNQIGAIVSAQSGGAGGNNYQLLQSVIAGGGETSGGGN